MDRRAIGNIFDVVQGTRLGFKETLEEITFASQRAPPKSIPSRLQTTFLTFPVQITRMTTFPPIKETLHFFRNLSYKKKEEPISPCLKTNRAKEILRYYVA